MYKIIILPHFRRQLKPLIKKYFSLKDTLIETLETFDTKKEISLGHNLYKIRISPKELKKGKSGAFRCIILCIMENERLIPITIYSKNDKVTLTTKELELHTEMILFELTEK